MNLNDMPFAFGVVKQVNGNNWESLEDTDLVTWKVYIVKKSIDGPGNSTEEKIPLKYHKCTESDFDNLGSNERKAYL